MTFFILTAAVFVAIGLAFILPPLLRRENTTKQETPRLEIYRQQLRELQQDFASGTLQEAQYQESENELKRRVLEENQPFAPAPRAASAARPLAIVIALSLPLASAGLYKLLGTPGAFAPLSVQSVAPIKPETITAEQFSAMTQRLILRLKEQPNDPQGWAMLAKAYTALGRNSDTLMAYDRAVLLSPNDPDLLAEYANATAMGNGGSLAGRPRELIEQALKIAPDNPKALALAGSSAFEVKNFSEAVSYWQRLLALVPKDSEIAKDIAANIAEANTNLGQRSDNSKPASSAQLSGSVKLADALKSRAKASDTVFIFARAAGAGVPKMPLAVWRGAVADLPKNFTLDDSMAMTPAMTLSKFDQVVVNARVSSSGNPIAQSGDLTGVDVVVKNNTKDITITIDRAVP